MKFSFNVSTTVTNDLVVNGKHYSSVDEMPIEVRSIYEKAMENARGVAATRMSTASTRFMFNGVEYTDMTALPPEARQAYDNAMAAMRTGTAERDVASAPPASVQVTDTTPSGRVRRTSFDLKSSGTESASLPKWLLTGLACAIIAILLYLVLS